jgi:hypothetical protein
MRSLTNLKIFKPTTTKESEFTMTVVQTFIMPSSPADRKIIMDAMVEISASMTRMEGEKEYIKEAISELTDKFSIPKKLLNRFAKTYHKQNYTDELGADSEFETLVQTLLVPSDSSQQ